MQAEGEEINTDSGKEAKYSSKVYELYYRHPYEVCYELYGTADRPGYGFVFERGGTAASMMKRSKSSGRDRGGTAVDCFVCESVGQLKRDFRQERFKEAFGARAQV